MWYFSTSINRLYFALQWMFTWENQLFFRQSFLWCLLSRFNCTLQAQQDTIVFKPEAESEFVNAMKFIRSWSIRYLLQFILSHHQELSPKPSDNRCIYHGVQKRFMNWRIYRESYPIFEKIWLTCILSRPNLDDARYAYRKTITSRVDYFRTDVMKMRAVRIVLQYFKHRRWKKPIDSAPWEN